MTVDELTAEANEFLADNYGMTLDIPIKINGRLSHSMGRFIICKGEAECIEIARKVINYGARAAIVDVLRHELIHYAMFTQGKPYHDGRDEFEAELRKHGVGSTGTNFIGRLFEYKCSKCGKTALTERERVAKYPERYVSKCCEEEIEITGERIIDGMEAEN